MFVTTNFVTTLTMSVTGDESSNAAMSVGEQSAVLWGVQRLGHIFMTIVFDAAGGSSSSNLAFDLVSFGIATVSAGPGTNHTIPAWHRLDRRGRVAVSSHCGQQAMTFPVPQRHGSAPEDGVRNWSADPAKTCKPASRCLRDIGDGGAGSHIPRKISRLPLAVPIRKGCYVA